MPHNIIQTIRRELHAQIDTTYKTSSQQFFKEGVTLYGVRVPIVRKIAITHCKEINGLQKQAILDICETLLSSGYQEEAIIAIMWTARIKDRLATADVSILEHWLGMYITNWATCDDFCLHVMSHLIVRYPSLVPRVKAWTQSHNRWLRRASAVSFIMGGGTWRIHDAYLEDVFAVAKALLTDEDDMVRKGYGWMLKVAADTHQKEVFDFVMTHKARMPRVSLRYAIEKMPQALKKEAMRR